MKKSIHIIPIILISALIISSCRQEDSLSDTEINPEAPVVEAYLVPGETAEVKVSQLLPFSDDEDVVQEPISDLTVTILTGNSLYEATEDTVAGNYFFNDDLIIEEGNQYKIEFVYNDFVINAETVIPTKPINFSISDGDIYVARVVEGETGMSSFDPIELSWDNTDNSYYIIKTEYLEATQDFINYNMSTNGMELPLSSTSTPILGDAYDINSRGIYFFGTYRIILYKINQEYVDLYETISQSSNSLSNPLTNVENGWGIFTGVNSDTLYLEVKEL